MMFPNELLTSPLFGIGLTVIAYCFSEYVVKKLHLSSLPPIVLACPIIMAVIMINPSLEYEHYEEGAAFINFLLGPATIALALPLIRNRKIIKEKAPLILGGICVATVTAICSVYVCGKMFGASEQVLLSLLPKSITTPIAVQVSNTIGGIPALTAAAVIFTGMIGAAFNHKVLHLAGVKSDLAIGLSIGASSHGIGTSACANVSAVQLAIGGVAIALTGIATSIFAPLLLPMLQNVL